MTVKSRPPRAAGHRRQPPEPRPSASNPRPDQRGSRQKPGRRPFFLSDVV